MPRPRVTRRAVLLLAATTLAVATTLAAAPTKPRAQGRQTASPPLQAPVPVAGLGSGRFATMQMLYERTIFRVDVLQLTVRFGPDTAAQIEHLVAGRRYDDGLAASVAETALRARDVLVRSRFLRHLSLDRFLDGIRENLEHAREDGLLTEDQLRAIFADIELRYEPLRDRGILDGDTVWYRVHGDRLQLSFETRDGELPVEETVEGPQHRLAVLGGYFSHRSDFREALVRSLFATD